MNWIAPPDGQRCRLIMKAGKGEQCFGTWKAIPQEFYVCNKIDNGEGVTGYRLQIIAERDVEEWAKA